MCIIIAKNKNNNKLPTKENLKNSFEYNCDGAGFMYVNNNKVVIDKGYMDEKSFLNRFDYLCKRYNNFKNKALVIHCRIGTSSGNTKENTHPYIISNKEKELHATYITSELGIAHNGIIHDYTPTEKKPTINDTQNFIIHYLFPIYSNFKDFYKIKSLRNGIEKITNSKFALLDKNENLYLIGDFIKENGIFYSNTSYKPFINYKYSNYYDNYYDKYFDDLYVDEKTNTNIDELLHLKNNWYISDNINGNFCTVAQFSCNNDLYYNPYTFELFKLDYNETYIKIADNIVVYNDEFVEVV